MQKLNALLIDDDKKFCQTFATLAEDSFNLTVAYNGKEGLNQFQKHSFDVIFLDLKLGRGMDGLEVLKRIKKVDHNIPVTMVTDYAAVDSAVEAMKLGAFHYSSKSPNIQALKLIIERQIEQISWRLLQEQEAKEQDTSCLTKNPAMLSILKQMEKIARTNATVLITGESGVGKEVCAREIHQCSQRNNKPFVPINCSALPQSLFESEFFGFERGAFTGAERQKKGKLELGNGGTIFLDEIGDLPLESQPKILRAIEEKRFERLGGTETIAVDVRIIAASNKNLPQMVTERQFREDLYYRLSVISIFLPPLRERAEDIPELTNLFVKRCCHDMNKPVLAVSPEAMKKLTAHYWPGNIRELKNIIEAVVVLHNSDQPIGLNEIQLKPNTDYIFYPEKFLNLPYEQAKTKLLNNFKHAYFQRALVLNNGNISATAKLLKLNRSAFHKMLNELKGKG